MIRCVLVLLSAAAKIAEELSLTLYPAACLQDACVTNLKAAGKTVDDGLICASKVKLRRDCMALLRWNYHMEQDDMACPWQDGRELFCLPDNLAQQNMMLDRVEAVGPKAKAECVETFRLAVVTPRGSEQCQRSYFVEPVKAVRSFMGAVADRAMRFVLPAETPLEKCYRIQWNSTDPGCVTFGLRHNNTEKFVFHTYRFFGSSAAKKPLADLGFDHNESLQGSTGTSASS